MKISANLKKISTFLLAVFLIFFFSTSYLFAFIERVSVDSFGNESAGSVSYYSPSISADGRYIAFASDAANLVPGDTNGFIDIFVYDRNTNTIERVSVDDLGNESDGNSDLSSISADGRYIAFASYATNLVPGDTNGSVDFFVYDRNSNTIERVSVDDLGNEGNADSDYFIDLSSDGRYAIFRSAATNLVPGDTNGVLDIFVYDRNSNTIERVSVDDLGNESDGNSDAPSISADGRYVSFSSGATNLVPGDTNGVVDIFVYDRNSNTIERVSVDDLGNEGDGQSVGSSISVDGRYVSFASVATNLVPGDTNGFMDVFVYDRNTNTIERMSVDDLGNEGDTDVMDEDFPPKMSSDGRYVAFSSAATNLIPGDTNGVVDIFVYDRNSNTIERVSVDDLGNEFSDESRRFDLSENGRYLVFNSLSSTIVPGDTNGLADIFVKSLDNSTPTDINLSNSSLQENGPPNTIIGTLSTTDADPGDTHTYSLACTVPGADDASFNISSDSLRSSSSFDYETKVGYSICIKTDDGNGGTFDKNFVITVSDVGEGSSGGGGSNPNPVLGCTDSDADNYNPAATQDNGSCLYTPGAITGCTNPVAGNYNAVATVDNGSCLYGIFGCMDPLAVNFNPLAQYPNNTCQYGPPIDPPDPNEINGCMDPGALNYNPNATVNSVPCDYLIPLINGCTDMSAVNYNEDATNDDGSCTYTDPPDDPPGGGGITPIINAVTGFVKKNPEIPMTVSILGLLIPLISNLLSPGNLARLISIPIRIWNIIPTLLGFKRRKRPWGTVYDSITKQPLDPVYVMLKTNSGKEIATSITDLDGRYGFQVEPGQYSLFANKANYIFPSVKLKGKTEDELYDNLYFGGGIDIAKEDEIINKNIPMDAINFNWNEFEKAKNKKLMKFYSKTELFLARISKILFIAGLISSIILALVEPKTFNLVILGLYALIIILALFGVKPRAFGFVTEKGTGYPLSFGIISVFSSELGREVAHSVIGKTGKYYLLVPKGNYFVKLRKKTGEEGYEEVFTSEVMNIKKGYLDKKFVI